MAYTPELSLDGSRTLRRIAWNLGMPMTKALEKIISVTAEQFPNYEVCETCRKPLKCKECVFYTGQQSVSERSL